MAKKRKASGRVETLSGPKEYDAADGKLAINTYEDVADSEDEFHINRDKVMLEDGPETKRRKKWQEEDAFLEPSDEEVLGYSTENSDDEDELEGPKKQEIARDSDEDDSKEEEEDVDAGGWGSSKRDYYDVDMIETEADALEEEAEAKRLQQKKLQKMSEADFGFDESEWLDAGKEDEGGDVVTEILKDIEITPDMSPEERLRILQTRYPEFEFLANEFVLLQPLLQDLQEESELEPKASSQISSVVIVKYRALAAYLAAISMYFAVLTSPAKDGKESRVLDPMELRDHIVMDSLRQCRELWSKVKSLKASQPIQAIFEDNSGDNLEIPQTHGAHDEVTELSKSKKHPTAPVSEAAMRRAEKIRLAEAEMADLSNLIPKTKKSSKKTSNAIVLADDDSDFGEEETLDAKSATEKANKKKSLRFYTSQVAQKANKRAGAGRDAGGDADLPYRERLKDRQSRLNAEAEKRGRKLDEYGRGADLGGESDEEDTNIAGEVRGKEDEYYDLVAQTSKSRKSEKDAKYAAIAQAKAEGKMVRVVEGEVDEDGKRAIGYVIEKNKGLAPKRKKDVRNPRVKKRKKFEEKKKKLASMKAVFKGGEEKGGYQGEKTGIKSSLIKSVRL
ncbi:hypothetical protein B7494_g370 [Chlorociboria aeruginascens]|nr:hypothetical protein B7494_g370 [Chlorociboria aeruginascens]